jgi:predicted SAM-dependent methyltransferase
MFVPPPDGRRIRVVSRLASAVIPRHTLTLLRWELYLAWVRLRAAGARRRFVGRQNLLVTVGCGTRAQPGWVNIDAVRLPGVTLVYDCRRQLPFEDNSTRAIVAEHFLEHVDYTEEAQGFLSECQRVLQPGGVLRIAVPDAEQYLQAYAGGGWEALVRLRPLREGRIDAYFKCAYHTRMELINVVFRQGGQHKFAYDFETLALLLGRCGFASIVRRQFNDSALPEWRMDSPRRATESLYVEAIK